MRLDGVFEVEPLAGSPFGGELRLCRDLPAVLEALSGAPGSLTEALCAFDGLLVLRDVEVISQHPHLLLELSRHFGPEVEDYRQTLTASSAIHPQVPEIFIVSNAEPVCRMPPPKPQPERTQTGGLPIQFPHRHGWHTDQSYRRPPPDISLFYAVCPAPRGQGQTLYANGLAAYAALPAETKARIARIDGMHVKPGTGRSESAVRGREPVQGLAPHERPQAQPLVREHPVSGRPALYLCEAGQMDWLDGPIAGMTTGPDGEGARLVYELMSHYTRPEFTYAHEWSAGEMTIYDNRCTVHAATWFDTECCERVMWRTTVRGNPGAMYDGEAPSWIPAEA